jgi:hypothetical protein
MSLKLLDSCVVAPSRDEQWFELSRRLGIADLIINAAETKPALKEA